MKLEEVNKENFEELIEEYFKKDAYFTDYFFYFNDDCVFVCNDYIQINIMYKNLKIDHDKSDGYGYIEIKDFNINLVIEFYKD